MVKFSKPLSSTAAFTASLHQAEASRNRVAPMVIFYKVLSKTDIKRRGAVPMQYFKMERFPKPTLEDGHMKDFVVIDESGHSWTLCCSTRNIGKDPNRPKHPKPVLINQWIPLIRRKKLGVGDKVIIYEQQDDTGSTHLRIKVERQTSPPEAPRSPVMNKNLDGNRASITQGGENGSEATLQPLQDLSAGLQNRDLGRNTAVKTLSFDKEQTPSPHSSYQQKACYKTEKPGQSLNLELTLKLTMTGEMSAATSSRIDKEPTPTFHSTSQGIACNKTETPGVSLYLGPTPKPMQDTEHKTIDFLRSFDRA